MEKSEERKVQLKATIKFLDVHCFVWFYQDFSLLWNRPASIQCRGVFSNESINGFNFLYSARFLEPIVVTQAFMMNDAGKYYATKIWWRHSEMWWNGYTYNTLKHVIFLCVENAFRSKSEFSKREESKRNQKWIKEESKKKVHRQLNRWPCHFT